ncbi:response regulator [Paenibacillus sp. HWE-109]|uniref:response regulator n=1 Tax=Paenibacillus sp. HWE-109 TaxID=1306526 RepID=UPI001EE0007B|nr:response regulator [Paenibacillus sp. HWE-109]UKS28718.1 response regulator [Paenibacillus sp. HWE-109]
MLKLLMVDDESWIRERFSERIPWSDAGFVFMGAASGAEEAIAMMERDLPHLLLTDITMPNMNGLELAAYVRKRWPRVRIVILTAYGEFEYARKAIGLGIDNYLIKLAQTPEQILEACRKVAEDIVQEMDVDQKLEMQLELAREQMWVKKRQWTDRLVSDYRNVNIPPMPGEWLIGMQPVSYAAGLTIGWRASVGKEAEQLSDEDLVQLQRQIGKLLEANADTQMAWEAGKFLLFPIRHNRLLLLIGSKQQITILHLNQLALAVRKVLQGISSIKSFVHVGHVQDLGKQSVTATCIAECLREGIDGLAAYFYKPDSDIVGKLGIALRRLEPELIRTWTANAVKALQRENAEAFQESVSVMRQLADPPIHPADLVRVTKQILQPELVSLPESAIARLTEIDRLETWAAYQEWWSAIIQDIREWFNKRLHPPVTVRKEIQLMCRYIHEHYKEDVQVVELAKLVQLHPSYAGQMFKQEVGENFSDYLNRVRMDKASELLERTSMKIYEVSGAVGISDYRYFCKLFKSYTGSTPTQYKNKQG